MPWLFQPIPEAAQLLSSTGRTGEATIAVPVPTLSATSALLIAATATIAIPVPTLSATSTLGISGTATIAIPVPTLTATGTIANPGITGEATIAVPVPTLSATSTLSIAGSASVAVPVPALSASSALSIAGSASIAVPVPALTAASALAISGAASIAVPVPALAATGTLSISGGASIAVPVPSLTATSTLLITGTAAISVPAPTLSAASTNDAPVVVTLDYLPDLRDQVSEAIAALTPSLAASDRFLESRHEYGGDFRAWAEANVAACNRRYSVTHRTDPELWTTATDYNLRAGVLEVVIAYPHSQRPGRAAAVDRDALIDSDRYLLEGTILARSGAALLGPPSVIREAGQGVDFLVVTYRQHYWEQEDASSDASGISGTTTEPALRNQIASLVSAIVPDSLSADRFRETRHEYDGSFRAWLSDNSPTAWRRFSVRIVDGGELRDSDHTGESRTVIFEVLVAYPHNHRAGMTAAIDRHRVIDEDRRAIEGAIGLRGFANFSSAAWVDGTSERDFVDGADLLIVRQTMHYRRAYV